MSFHCSLVFNWALLAVNVDISSSNSTIAPVNVPSAIPDISYPPSISSGISSSSVKFTVAPVSLSNLAFCSGVSSPQSSVVPTKFPPPASAIAASILLSKSFIFSALNASP